MKHRTMVDYVDRVHEENERLRSVVKDKDEIISRYAVLDTGRRNKIAEQRRLIAALQLERGTWECRWGRAFAGWERSQDQVDRLFDKLAAVRARCEGNNWGGTARVCGEVK